MRQIYCVRSGKRNRSLRIEISKLQIANNIRHFRRIPITRIL
jgi:hypothetical protein